MIRLTKSVYQCPSGQPLNTGRWWTNPVPSPTNSDIYYLCGGNVEDVERGKGTDSCVSVDLNSCTITPLPNKMGTSRQDTRPACITRGQCYFFGGNTEAGEPRGAATSIDFIDLNNGTLKPTPFQLKEPRLCYATANLDQGTLVAGGYGLKDASGMGPVLKSSFVIKASGITPIPDMNYPRGGHSITPLKDGTFLIVGGIGNRESQDPTGAEIYDPKTNTFRALKSKLTYSRKDHRAILANDGRVYIIGGTSTDKTQPTTIEVYDPRTETFSLTPLQIEGREDLAVEYIPQLNIIVAVGGEIKGRPGEPESKRIDVLDLTNQTVTSDNLQETRDEPQILVRSVDEKKKTATILILSGQHKVGTKEVSLPAELLTISIE